MTINEDKIINVDHNDEISFPNKIATLAGIDFDGKRINSRSEYGHIDYHFFTLLNDIKIIVHDCIVEKEVGVRHLPKKDADFIYIMLLREGDITHIYESDSKIEVFGPGKQRGLIISNLRKAVINYGAEGTRSQWVTIMIKKHLLDDYFGDRFHEIKELIHNPEPWLFFESHTYEIATALDQVFEAERNSVSYKSIVYSQSIFILGQIFEFLTKRDVDDVKKLDSFDTERLFAIREFITKDLSNPPSLELICDEFGISRSKLIRDFKAEFGKPLYQFYTQLRMDEARNMLVHQKKTVTEVSQELGFKGISKFSDAFKKHFGMSPKVMIELKNKP
ncbi:helix-turn-helix transcriptional regulator [Flammeovirga aprica]|uniref:Helix-turn-helix transcriptional regulator n=1 Tax=Flammeovirga aprica JL-4 TaxID=694437 RepID=A0A7X9XAW7_9BACT|nr:AraC family transcriptional regulator [Flammeovirga aprica]NME70034.1 helix-turn-helix transcriptional regulator [Flammeovirga aprica JL-4]